MWPWAKRPLGAGLGGPAHVVLGYQLFHVFFVKGCAWKRRGLASMDSWAHQLLGEPMGRPRPRRPSPVPMVPVPMGPLPRSALAVVLWSEISLHEN